MGAKVILEENTASSTTSLRLRPGVLSEHWYISTRLYDVMPEISRDSVAGMVTRLRAEGSWLRIPVKAIDFSLPQSVQNRSTAQQASYTKLTAHGSSLGEKRSGREVGHSHHSRTEITSGAVLLLPSTDFMAR